MSVLLGNYTQFQSPYSPNRQFGNCTEHNPVKKDALAYFFIFYIKKKWIYRLIRDRWANKHCSILRSKWLRLITMQECIQWDAIRDNTLKNSLYVYKPKTNKEYVTNTWVVFSPHFLRIWEWNWNLSISANSNVCPKIIRVWIWGPRRVLLMKIKQRQNISYKSTHNTI
jgi:hypothetical protein